MGKYRNHLSLLAYHAPTLHVVLSLKLLFTRLSPLSLGIYLYKII